MTDFLKAKVIIAGHKIPTLALISVILLFHCGCCGILLITSASDQTSIDTEDFSEDLKEISTLTVDSQITDVSKLTSLPGTITSSKTTVTPIPTSVSQSIQAEESGTSEISKKEELISLNEHLVYLQDKVTDLEQAKGLSKSKWAFWSRNWNIDLQEHKDVYTEDHGANINEYEGFCRNAFFYIGVAYSDVFILWLSYDNFYENSKGTEFDIDVRSADLKSLFDKAQIALTTCQQDL